MTQNTNKGRKKEVKQDGRIRRKKLKNNIKHIEKTTKKN